MLGGIKDLCANCGEQYTKKAAHQKFCKRECYRASENRSRKVSVFPKYLCPSCNTSTQLDFYPKKSLYKWSSFICPGCEHYKENDDYFIIKEIKDIMREE